MKKIITPFFFWVFMALILFSTGVNAQRPMDKLARSVVAQKVSNGVYVNWRITSDEWYNTSYKLYRNGTFIYETGATGASNYLDPSGTTTSKYTVSKVRNGIESAQSAQASVLTQNYLELPMRNIKKLGKELYYLNDATAADLDGDGEYEIIIKRMRRDWTAACTDFTYFEAYKLDGTFMWAIDVGPNITMDVEINIAAFDFDGDGKAEVFMRSSDNTVFGLDINNQNGTSVGDRDKDGYTNYRQAPFYGIGGDGFMNKGPEYLSLIDGETGKELDWVNFIPRGQSSDWGDDYGHRTNKFFFGAPYLDGKKPSLFIGRGIYTMTKMQTYDIVNKKLVKKWNWETTSWTIPQQGKYDDSPKNYFGQGYHNYVIADVDGDGCDEINWGSMTIDNDGKPLYSTELGHGDAQHYSDLDPYRKGLEAFACNEDHPGTNLRDAKTGQILYRKVNPSDVGRAGAGNITDALRGAEVWGGGAGLSATDRVAGSTFGVAESNCIYWDGDLLQEICDHRGFSTATGVGYGSITKFINYGNVTTLLDANAYSCNYTKGTPCLQADILGDWREEAIWWRSDSLALRIYTTPIATTNRIYTLMHDAQYRQAICWQMCGYNQPPHASFYLGSEFPTPVPAQSTNGKLIWNGTNSTWDASTSNFMNGNDAAGLYAGTSPQVAFAAGNSVLFDTHSAIRNINITGTLSPEVLTVGGIANYTLGGSGTLTGAMHLDKMGDSTLVMTGTHSYTGATDVWEGNMWMNGTLSASPVIIRRHANFGGNGTYGNGITTEYNAGFYIGGQNIAGTTTVNGTLKLVSGAKLCFDLSNNPAGTANDKLTLNGTMVVEAGSIIHVTQTNGILAEGSYLLAKVDALTGSLAAVKVHGAVGVATELSYNAESKELFLIIKGVRAAGSVIWTGKTDSNWDLAKTANWDNDGSEDIFAANDSVLLNSEATNRTITLTDNLPVAHLEVNSISNYTITGSGSLSGTMDLYKTNTGSLTILNRNTYTGKTVVDGGSLIMTYAPSSTNNGGIGTNSENAANFVVKDSALVQITTAGEITGRGMTMAGTAGGILNVPSSLYWDGLITGTTLTKNGAGILYLTGSNPTLNQTVLDGGRIKLNSGAAVQWGVGKKLTLLSGTLETLNGIGSYLTSSHIIEVPQGKTATYIAGARCEYNGALIGGGTINWVTDYIRSYINGNWSAFTGTINLVANSANSTYENQFLTNNSNGFPNAIVSVGTGVKMTPKTAGSILKVGMLNGVGEVVNASLEVGSNDKNGLFSGVISGTSTVKKVGSGIWYITGTNTYTGATTISSGSAILNGSLSTGTVTVSADATLAINGEIGGSLIISNGGEVSITGTVKGMASNTGILKGNGTIAGNTICGNKSAVIPGSSTLVGALSFGGNLTMNAGSTLSMQVNGGAATCDKVIVTGTTTCNGTLEVVLNTGAFAIDNAYQIIKSGTISGTFTEIKLPALDTTLEWDLTELYTTGTLKIKQSTGIHTPSFKSGVVQNPSTGIFRIYTENVTSDLKVMVTNLQGKMIYESVVTGMNGKFNVDLTEQPAGIYLLKLVSETESSNVLKLIKK